MEHGRVGGRRGAAHRATSPHGRRRAPRYGRILMLAGSLVLTVTAAGAAAGFVPHAGDGDPPAWSDETVSGTGDETTEIELPTSATSDATLEPSRDDPAPRRLEHGDPSQAPADSGHGRRVVYDISDQRVWLVEANGAVRRSYLVSGSVLHNLRPGSYRVYSRSLHAVAFDQLSTMDYMVRFTEGANASIGFHDIPEDLDGQPVQTVSQLGTPRSHGCIRQRLADAKAMWRFATIDTPVRVLA